MSVNSQNSSVIVDVSSWPVDPEWEFVSQGVKPKHWLRAPEKTPYRFIIPEHRYLFKYASSESEAMQVYSEAVAYQIARELDAPVPPAFLAVDYSTGRFGCIIESFLDHKSEVDTRFVHAIELFQNINCPIDERVGSLRDNIRISKAYKVPYALEWWKRTIVFDALIGNTDRHSENWGLVITRQPFVEPRYDLAPIFDNGTSLGWRIDEGDLARHSTAQSIDRLVARGNHHFGWLSGDRASSVHHVLCAHVKKIFGDDSGVMARMIQLSDSDVERILVWACSFDAPTIFSEQRAEFMSKFIVAKREALRRALEV